MMRRVLCVWLVVVGVCAVSAPAQAAGISVTSGYLDMRGSSGPILFAGDRGFTFDGTVAAADGVFGPASCNGSPSSCVPGATLDLTALWVGGDLRGTASLDGRVFSGVGSASGITQLAVHFSGSATLPSASGGTASVSAPFQFDGTFDHPDAAGAAARDTLGGGGLAIVSLAPSQVVAGAWYVTRVTYVFGTLPAGWVATDVGQVGTAGDTATAPSGFVVHGAGADVWGTADGFRFTFQRLDGDGAIVTRVDSQSAAHPFAKAGLMLRDGIGADAAHVILDVKPNGEIEFMTRAAAGGETSYLAGAFVRYPVWLMLQRSGTLVTASYALDGQHWTPLATASLTRASYAGLLVSSHETGRLSEGRFSESAVIDGSGGLPSGWSHIDVGAVGVSGSARVSTAGAYTVTGAGADIWGSTDAFHYVFQPVDGTSRIVARVMSLRDTNTFAKAGVMIRDGVAPDAAHVILDMRPSGEVEFMARGETGGQTTYFAGAFNQFPGWLMLERQGSVVIGSVSDDGQTWHAVGSLTVTLPAAATAGLVVTSHDLSQSTAAIFDAVTIAP